MIPGYNHNVKYKDKLFHVQTEDSGPAVPVITTHVFLGGNIVASKKTQYGDLIKRGEGEDAVRKLMQNQHKEIMRELVTGKYDDTIASFEKPSTSFEAITEEKAPDVRTETLPEPVQAQQEPMQAQQEPMQAQSVGQTDRPVSVTRPLPDPHSLPTKPGVSLESLAGIMPDFRPGPAHMPPESTLHEFQPNCFFVRGSCASIHLIRTRTGKTLTIDYGYFSALVDFGFLLRMDLMPDMDRRMLCLYLSGQL